MCALDGGDIGYLERLGVRKCAALLKVLAARFWPEKDEKWLLT
jgi:hypothetical protein